MDAHETLLCARAILSDVTPLKTDCGRGCGHACCEADEDGQGGMLLFPTEEELYDPLPDGFCITRDRLLPNALLITCEGRCERALRPLSCMLFPLLPRERDGRVRAVRDGRAWAVCPLMDSGLSGLDPAFVTAVRRAGEILCACPTHRMFLENLHRLIASFRTGSL